MLTSLNFTAGASTSLIKSPSGANNWGLDGFCVTSSNLNSANGPVKVSRSGISSGFSDFAIVVDQNTPFPVALTRLQAEGRDDHIAVRWTTEREVNNAGFTVLRSLNPNQGFHKIGWREGQGTSSESHAYQLQDADVLRDTTYYYRLKQHDLDGQTTLTKVVEARLADGNRFSWQLYPTLASQRVKLRISAPRAADAQLQVLDMAGRSVLQREVALAQGRQTLPLKVDRFAKGTYAVKLQYQGEVYVKRFVKP
jgi:hypothetical protein